LDVDNDGRLSEEERQRIAENVQKLDLDNDGTISTAELNPLGGFDQPMSEPQESSSSDSVLVALSAASRRGLASRLIERYSQSKRGTETPSGLRPIELGLAEPDFKRFDIDGEGTLDLNELMHWLRHAVPAVEVAVRLGKREAAQMPIEVIHSEDRLPASLRTEATDRAVLAIGKRRIEMEIDYASHGDRIVLQVGPQAQNLYEILDTNGDSRLSPRELRAATGRLQLLGGDVALSEIPTPARLAFRLAASNAGPSQEDGNGKASAGPAWFPLMDTNGDGDLSPSEFLGRREQFRALDADGDGLIDIDEASKYSAFPIK
jgi:Ca2+-binding EF-hand superfamily protein